MNVNSQHQPKSLVSLCAPILVLCGGWWIVSQSLFETTNTLETYEASRLASSTTLSGFAAGLAGVVAMLWLWLRIRKRALHSEQHIAILEEKLKQTKSTARAKSEYVSNISHEIRTPLTAIVGFADTLLDSEIGQRDQERAVETIKRNCDYLLKLINDILHLSKIDAGKMGLTLTPTEPAVLANDVLQTLQKRANVKGLTMILDTPDNIPQCVKLDHMRVQQILMNLVSNAVKFTKEGWVEVSLGWQANRTAPRLGNLQVVVSDSGPGMEKAQLISAFEPYIQTHLQDPKNSEGTGLGLCISQKLARLMGGKLEAESWINQGSTFKLTIPTEVCESAATSELVHSQHSPLTLNESRNSFDLSGKRVLLAEDSKDIARLVNFMLSRLGAEVEVAYNGEQTVRLALGGVDRARHFDAIIMDMQMPIMDGYEATKKLRQDGLKVPIIALTACAMDGDRERCLRAGCDAYLAKPIHQAALSELLETVFSNKALNNSADKDKDDQSQQTWKESALCATGAISV